MENKNIFSKYMLQTRAKYKNSKILTCLQGLLPWGMLKEYSARISSCQNSDIREVCIALVL